MAVKDLQKDHFYDLPGPDDQELLDNIDGRLHGPMNGFVKRYFGNLLDIADGSSAAPSPKDFLRWFSSYVSREVDGARGIWHIASEDTSNNTRLLLGVPSVGASEGQARWDDIQVIGQFYESASVCYHKGLLRLCQSAYQVFASQPTRLFLHGFYIRGSMVEFWVFDRSGTYCSSVLDLQTDYTQFLSIIVSYQRMPDQDLGQLNLTHTDEGGSYINAGEKKLYLESRPIASRERLVGTGTACYRARRPGSDQWDYVLKFKWRWARDRPEDELLKLAKQKSVWGAISVDHYEDSNRKYGESAPWLPVGDTQKIRQKPFHSRRCKYQDTDNYFQNRILVCIVASPVGRPLDTFKSRTELLQMFRDAIKCHRSLYQDAKILHQDVSAGNVIILDGEREGEPRGVLIDLDSAVEVDVDTEDDAEPSIVGTRPFMAVGVLKEERHTYRHDLESFLYIFLWIIITNHREDPPEGSKLQQWSNGSWEELAERKFLDMSQDDRFGDILEEFAPEFHSLRTLAERLRRILFPVRDGVIWTGTEDSPEAVDMLYDQMIREFKEAAVSEGR